MQVDVIVVGGSFAGLSAALQLARARCQVVVIDSGLRRNRFTRTSHGFLGQDGRAPADIVADAKTQLLAYPTVRWLAAEAASAEKIEDGFAVSTAAGETLQARRLVLASGVVDELAPLEGLAERWGQSVFACPYCDGYELDMGRIGVLATGPMAMHQALMLPDWGTVTLFLNDAFMPDEAQQAALAARGVSIEKECVTGLADHATMVLQSGRQVVLDGLFTMGRTHMASALPAQLGCAFDEGPMGPVIRTSDMMETTIAGVFACGDAARMFSNVATAVGTGAMAGAAAHRSMIFGLQGSSPAEGTDARQQDIRA